MSFLPACPPASRTHTHTHTHTHNTTQVKERKSELARLETSDMGKPIAEAEWDMDDVAGCFEYYAGRAQQGPAACPSECRRESALAR